MPNKPISIASTISSRLNGKRALFIQAYSSAEAPAAAQ